MASLVFPGDMVSANSLAAGDVSIYALPTASAAI
jgi:hypothetical protein